MTVQWKKGKKWEDKALHKYKEVKERKHDTFRITKSGLVIRNHIFLGASPDGKCLTDDVKPLINNVDFDEALFESLVSASFKFWFGHLLPEILSKRLKNICEEDPKDNDMDYNITPEKLYVTVHMYVLHLDSSASPGNNCPICHTLCKDEEGLSVLMKEV